MATNSEIVGIEKAKYNVPTKVPGQYITIHYETDIGQITDLTGLSHNGIYRGKNFGTFTSLSAVEQFLSDHGVSTGLFKDLYLGDYFKVQDGTYNVEWEIAGFDTYYQKGDTAFTNHHIALIPKTNLLQSKMNDTNETTGGYYNS